MWLKPYEILATGPNCGLIELVNDAVSLDEIHKEHGNLFDYFIKIHGKGKIKCAAVKRAQNAFL